MAGKLLRSAEAQVRRDLIIGFLALVSVGIGISELLAPEPSETIEPLDLLDLLIVALFIADYVLEARRSGSPAKYVRAHWWELPALIPIVPGLTFGLKGVTLLRALRLVRFARVFRLLYVIGAAKRIRHATRYVARVAERAQLLKIATAGAFLVVLGAAAIYATEGPVNPRVATLSGSIWWSLNLVTNVVYVDWSPATSWGYAIAGVLEIGGIAFIGVFAGSIAGAILREPTETDKEE